MVNVVLDRTRRISEPLQLKTTNASMISRKRCSMAADLVGKASSPAMDSTSGHDSSATTNVGGMRACPFREQLTERGAQ